MCLCNLVCLWLTLSSDLIVTAEDDDLTPDLPHQEQQLQNPDQEDELTTTQKHELPNDWYTTIPEWFTTLKDEVPTTQKHEVPKEWYTTLSEWYTTLKDEVLTKLTPDETHVCPEGFFGLDGSNRCFKFFEDDYRNWEEAQTKCQQEGLVMLGQTDDIALQLKEYIQETYYECYVWLNARKDDDGNFIWQADKTKLFRSNQLNHNLWTSPQPIFTRTYGCLYMSVLKLKSYSTQPYSCLPCEYGQAYALCEVI